MTPATGTPIIFKPPNGHHINSTGTTSIECAALPPTTRTAHVLPQLDPHSLISNGVLCDHNCIATFDKELLQIHQHNTPILQGPAYQTVSGVYPYIPNNHKLMPCSPNKHNKTSINATTQPPSVQVSALYLRPPNDFFRHLAQPYIPSHLHVLATIRCHHQRPSQPTTTTSPQTILRRDTPNTHRTIYAAILDPKQPTGNSFSNVTGRFPIQLNCEANYIFVLYDYDSNAILVGPLRNRSAQKIQRVFTSVHAYSVTHGL